MLAVPELHQGNDHPSRAHRRMAPSFPSEARTARPDGRMDSLPGLVAGPMPPAGALALARLARSAAGRPWGCASFRGPQARLGLFALGPRRVGPGHLVERCPRGSGWRRSGRQPPTGPGSGSIKSEKKISEKSSPLGRRRRAPAAGAQQQHAGQTSPRSGAPGGGGAGGTGTFAPGEAARGAPLGRRGGPLLSPLQLPVRRNEDCCCCWATCEGGGREAGTPRRGLPKPFPGRAGQRASPTPRRERRKAGRLARGSESNSPVPSCGLTYLPERVSMARMAQFWSG